MMVNVWLEIVTKQVVYELISRGVNNLLTVRLQRKKDELNDLCNSLFNTATLKIEWRSSELAFYDPAIKTLSNCGTEIEAKIKLLHSTLQFLNGRFSVSLAQKSEEKRSKKRRTDNRNNEIRMQKQGYARERKSLSNSSWMVEIVKH